MMRRIMKCVARKEACVAVLVLAAAGCGGSRESVSSSGDPEADQRADMRLGSEDGKGNAKQTLYQRLGGEKTIVALVDDMTARAIADPRVNFERQNVKTSWIGGKYKAWEPTQENIDRFKQHMVEFLTLATGGPTDYSGRDMRTAHKGMRISNNEFDAMIGDVKTSMDKLGLGRAEKRDLLAVVETTRKEIVEKQ
jgi:hemoglobin